jgi:hypothetical protein
VETPGGSRGVKKKCFFFLSPNSRSYPLRTHPVARFCEFFFFRFFPAISRSSKKLVAQRPKKGPFWTHFGPQKLGFYGGSRSSTYCPKPRHLPQKSPFCTPQKRANLKKCKKRARTSNSRLEGSPWQIRHFCHSGPQKTVPDPRFSLFLVNCAPTSQKVPQERLFLDPGFPGRNSMKFPLRRLLQRSPRGSAQPQPGPIKFAASGPMARSWSPNLGIPAP